MIVGVAWLWIPPVKAAVLPLTAELLIVVVPPVLAIPPPKPQSAWLALMTQLLTFRFPPVFTMPPPKPLPGLQLGAELLFTMQLVRFNVPPPSCAMARTLPPFGPLSR